MVDDLNLVMALIVWNKDISQVGLGRHLLYCSFFTVPLSVTEWKFWTGAS